MKIKNINIDRERIEYAHYLPEDKYLAYAKFLYPQAKAVTVPDGREYIYIDKGAEILGIAHLDATMPPTHFAWGTHYTRPNHTCIFSPMVDDRLGSYTLLELLPQVGIECDIILSVGEEIGNPTSQWFGWEEEEKKYNWMFQFDRMGMDAVHYCYTEKPWLRALAKYFNPISHGAFSDIDFMDHLEICGVNIGTGYHDYTREGAWASLNELVDQINKFKGFYTEFKNKKFHHIYNEYRWASKVDDTDLLLEPVYNLQNKPIY